MPEPQGNAPQEKNKGNTNFIRAGGARKNVSASRFDQIDNKNRVMMSSNSMSNLRAHAKARRQM